MNCSLIFLRISVLGSGLESLVDTPYSLGIATFAGLVTLAATVVTIYGVDVMSRQVWLG